MTASTTPADDLVAVLPEYEILGELGRGSMGVVLLGRHRNLGRYVAIKELPHFLASDDGVRSRFVEEARTVAHLSHPHVVTVYDFIDRDGHLALVMERLAGGTVWDRFVNQGVNTATACGLMLSAAAGLDHAHRHGVLHRDVKPENLMFSTDGQLKVTDFGIAKAIAGEKTVATADGTILGTPAYMSPEQAEGLPVGPSADVYACGTILYELLTGQLPFADAQTPMALLLARVKQEAPPIQIVAPNLAPAIADVANRALARSIEYRYPSVREFAVALGHAAATTWGLEWLSSCGVTVTGSEQILRAARTTRHLKVIDLTESAANHSTANHSTANQPGAIGRGWSGDDGAKSESQGHQYRRLAEVAAPPRRLHQAPLSVGWPDPLSPIDSPQNRPRPLTPAVGAPNSNMVPSSNMVMPTSGHDYPMIDLSLVSPTELIDIGEIRRRSRAAPLWLLSATFAMIAIVIVIATPSLVPSGGALGEQQDPASALRVNGHKTTDFASDLPIDFTKPITLAGIGDPGEVKITASSLGIPLGSVESAVVDGQATISAENLRWTTAGKIDLRIEATNSPEILTSFRAIAAHRWYTTVPAILAALAALVPTVWFWSVLHRLKQGQSNIWVMVGGFLGGAIAGASFAILNSYREGVQLTPAIIVTTAAATSIAGVAFSEGFRCFHRYRRLQRGLAP